MTFLSIMRKATITVAAAGALAFAAAGVASAETSGPAQAVPQSSELAAQVQQGGEGQVGPLDTTHCTEQLAIRGYEVTTLRFGICAAAAIIGTPGAAAACGFALVATGVWPNHAAEACLLAIALNSRSTSAGPV